MTASPRSKCTSCDHYRVTRGSAFCDPCAEDYWWWNGGDEWQRDMAEFGWAATPATHRLPEPVRRISLIAERRWAPAPPKFGLHPSTLWDASTPTTGVV